MWHIVTSREVVHGGEAEEDVVHYIIKREFSETSIHIKSLTFPLAALLLDDESLDLMFRYVALYDGVPEAQDDVGCVSQ